MSAADEMPSLAGLRRSRSVRRPRTGVALPSTPSLFDPAPRPEPTEQLKARRAEPEIQSVERAVWSVSALVQSARGLVEQTYAQVTVEGEISNWRPAASGHCYYTLKDGAAQLSVVMFRKQAALLGFKPKDGDAVRLRGQLSVYENRGQMQLIAETMEQVGMGALLAAVRELKERLRREGLFDRKRALPEFPRCIGVVTSAQGAALRDIVKVCRRRHAAVRLLVYPAAVQGANCAEEVAAGVRWFSEHPDQVDVVMVARGGGSWEDLHGFDAETVARAIAACRVPVITGIGHAVDSTVADAAADVCAPTPSAAAELVTAAHQGLGERLLRLDAQLRRAGRYEVLRARQRLSRLSAEMVLRRVGESLARHEQRVDELAFRAESRMTELLRGHGEQLQRLEMRLRLRHAGLRIRDDRRRLHQWTARLTTARLTGITQGRTRLERTRAELAALSPLRVLERGYALVYAGNGKLLRDAADVRAGEEMVTQLAKGRVRSRVSAKDETR